MLLFSTAIVLGINAHAGDKSVTGERTCCTRLESKHGIYR